MKITQILLSIVLGLALVACGGGGGSSGSTASISSGEITGQAATGAPMSFATVFIRGYQATEELLVYADVDGNFKIPSSLSKFPALVIATSANGKQTFYGYIKSSSQKTVAVNPITTTLLGLAAKARNYDLYSLGQAFTDSDLQTAQAQAVTIFGKLFDATRVNRGVDLLSTTFSTDHSGLDLVLDYISVGVDRSWSGGAVRITNKLDGKSYYETPLAISPVAFNSNTAFVSGLLDRLGTLDKCSVLIKSYASGMFTNSGRYFASNFLDSGLTSSQYITKITNVVRDTPIEIVSSYFNGMDANGNYQFKASVHNKSSGEFLSDVEFFTTINANGDCKFVGNQHPFEISIQPAIKHHVRYDREGSSVVTRNTTAYPVAGLEIQVGAWQGLGNQNKYEGVSVTKAQVMICDENSLCQNIASLTSPGATGVFSIDGSPYDFLHMIPNPNIPILNGNPNPIKVVFYDSSNNQIGSPIYAKISGDYFSTDDVTSIKLPSVTNAEKLLTTESTWPTVYYNAGDSVIGTIHLQNVTQGGVNQNAERLIVRSGVGSSQDFAGLIEFKPNPPSYKAIYVSGYIPGKSGLIEVKYFYGLHPSNY